MHLQPSGLRRSILPARLTGSFRPSLRTSSAGCPARLTQAREAASPDRLCPLVARGHYAGTHPQAQRAVWLPQAPLEISSLGALRRPPQPQQSSERDPRIEATSSPLQVSAQVTPPTHDLMEGHPAEPTLPTSAESLFQELRAES